MPLVSKIQDLHALAVAMVVGNHDESPEANVEGFAVLILYLLRVRDCWCSSHGLPSRFWPQHFENLPQNGQKDQGVDKGAQVREVPYLSGLKLV